MLSKCSWKGEKVNCSDIFTPVITDSGICCAFNLQDNLRDSDYSRLVHAMQGESRGPSKEKMRKVVSGIGRGLEVVLDQNSDRSKAANTDIITFSIFRISDKSVFTRLSGFRLFLGQPSEFPLLQRSHLVLKPGMGHSVQVSMSWPI